MGAMTDATIEANEANARKGTVVAAHPGYFLLHTIDWKEPILAWRIGEAECNCVLPVTCTGTYGSQNFVLCPNGRVRYHAVMYGSAVPDFESIEAWRAFMDEQDPPLRAVGGDLPF